MNCITWIKAFLSRKSFISLLTILFTSGILTAMNLSPASAATEVTNVWYSYACQLTGNHEEAIASMCGNDYPRHTACVEGADDSYCIDADVYGTDLGSMFSVDENTNDPSKLYVVFGDTHGPDITVKDEFEIGDKVGRRSKKRPHVIATIKNPQDIEIQSYEQIELSPSTNDWYGEDANPSGHGLIGNKWFTGNLQYPADVTAIPSSGLGNANNVYLWMVHFSSWNPPTVRESAVWRFESDFTVPSKTNFRFPFYSKFSLGTMLLGDEYIYTFGTQFYRKGPVFLARTKIADVLADKKPTDVTKVFNENETWGSYSSRCTRRNWLTRKCLAGVDASNAKAVVDDPGYNIGELSVIYLPYRDRYVMLYYRINSDYDMGDPSTLDAGIMIRTAGNPWGEWSDPMEVLNCSGPANGADYCYGSYTHPSLVRQDGKKDRLYMVVSVMHPPGTSGLWDCQDHPYDPLDPNSLPCNDIYNTFVGVLEFTWK